MARIFVAASSQALEQVLSAAITGPPITLACWFKPGPAASVNNNHIMSVSSLSGGNSSIMDLVVPGATMAVRAQEFDGSTNGIATTPGALTVGVWGHAAAVFTNDGNRTAYVNGVGTNDTTNAPTLTSLNRAVIGATYLAGALSGFSDGTIAEAGIWSIALSAADILALAAGVCPLFVRPDKLVTYIPLMGAASPEVDLFNNAGMSLDGTPAAAAHVPIYRKMSTRAFPHTTVIALDKLGWRGDFPDIILDSAFEAVSSGFIPRPPANPTDPTPT